MKQPTDTKQTVINELKLFSKILKAESKIREEKFVSENQYKHAKNLDKLIIKLESKN